MSVIVNPLYEDIATHVIDMIDDTLSIIADTDEEAVEWTKKYRDRYDDYDDEGEYVLRKVEGYPDGEILLVF